MNDVERKALAEKTETMIARWKMGQEINRFDAWDLMQQCATALRETPIRGIDAASLPTLTDEQVERAAAIICSEMDCGSGCGPGVGKMCVDAARALFQPAAEATPHRGCGCVYRGKHIAWNVDACPQHKRKPLVIDPEMYDAEATGDE